MRFFATIFFFLFLVGRVQAGGITATQLSCEQTVNPLGIDQARPAFGWQLRSAERGQFQTAFEMIVGDRVEQVLAGTGNIWQTGKRNAAENNLILFEGKPLRSFTRYFWRVRVYDRNGKASEWSPVAWFETAMLSAADWKAQWISDGKPILGTDAGFYKDDPMPVFKQAVAVTKPVKTARLYIAGAGYFETYLNGEKIGKDWLSPGWTNFDKRILYRVYDITANLQKGRNIAGLMLGNGWYNPLPMKFWGVYNLRDALVTGRPVVKAQIRITYADGTTETTSTDNSWKWKAGPVIRNSVYLGETFDGRADAKAWLQQAPESGDLPAAIAIGPRGRLQADLQPPVRVAAVIKPVAITEVAPGTFVADMGVNFAGVARIRVKASLGTRISLRYGEDVYKNGNVNGMTAVAGQIKNGNGGPGAPPVAWQEDHFIAGGGGVEIWNPRFTFHVFRYVELTGWPGKPTVDDIEGLQMHADVPDAGVFECSNPLFNKIQELTLRTFKSNIFSVQSDCAGREKFGYGGDLFCTLESFSYNFDMYNFYRKSLQDFEDDQRPLGGITETAPYVGLHDKGPGDASGPLGWQLGYPYLVKKLYEFYGDKRVIETYYPSLTKQIRFLEDSARGFLYPEDISDHESLDPKPVALTASLFFFHHVQLMRGFSELLNKKAEAGRYAALEAKIRAAIRKRFYKGAGVFDNQTQAAQLFPLWYGIAEEKEQQAVLRQLVQAFAAKNNHVSTGIFATKMLFDVLRVHDLDTLAYTIVNQKDFPGWGHMVAQGATTLWETWKYSDNTYSQNHPMFGSVSEWFYRSLLGINATAPGFKSFSIQPRPVAGLSFAKGRYRTPYGTIGSSWEQHAGKFLLRVEIPVNTMAEVWIPALPGSVLLDGKKAGTQGTVVFLKETQGYQVYKVASGTYAFSSHLK